MAKKIITILLAFCMVIGIAACGSQETPTETKTETKQESTTEKEPAEAETKTEQAEEVDIWAAFPETVTLTSATSVVDHATGKFAEGEDQTNNPWTTAWLERFNVAVEYKWLAENSSDYNTKINLSIADNDLPDVFSVSDIATLQSLIDAGIAMDITEVFDTYASDTVKGYMEALPAVSETAYKDGRMYAVPQMTYGIIDQPYSLWIRDDWMKEQSLEAPKTYDEFVEMLRVFNKEYGAVLPEQSSLKYMMKLAEAFGAHPQTWIRTENGVEYGGVQPEMKDVLNAYGELYAEGLLYDEFMIADGTKVSDMQSTGQTGAYIEVCWAGGRIGNMMEVNGTDAYVEAYEIPTVSGDPMEYAIKFSNNGYTVINSQCENPEAVIKLINYFAKVTFEGDEEPEMYAELNRVNPVVVGTFKIYDPQCDYQQHVDIADALKTGDGSKLVGLGTIQKYEKILLWVNDKDKTGLGSYYQVGHPERSAYAVNKEILDSGRYFYDVKWGKQPQSMMDAGSTLDDLLLQGYTKIIMGEEPLEYFDELVASWKAAGGDKVTQDMNEMYQ